MKKKIIIIIAAICAVFVLGITVGAIMPDSLGISTGSVLISENGTYFLIKGNTPVRLSDYSENGDIFPDLESGDKILVLHGALAESYPASALCRFCVKIGDGDISDIPEEVISSMTSLGWLGIDTPESTLSFSDEPVYIGDENANFSISVPEGWSYETAKSDVQSENKFFSISLYPASSPENAITVEFTDSFGVCGTGLRTEDITIGEYKAHKGIYDGSSSFSYIVFEDTPGFYVIQNNTSSSWWAEHKNEVMEILGTIKIAEGIILHGEALEIALSQAKGEYIPQYNEYSAADGIWTFVFETDETAQNIAIDKNGNILYNAKT